MQHNRCAMIKKQRGTGRVNRPFEIFSYLDGRRNLPNGWLARRPHWHVHFTPTSASWLNQVERWFAELTPKQIPRGVHRSVAELEACGSACRIDPFIGVIGVKRVTPVII
jgi:hypothetical protein